MGGGECVVGWGKGGGEGMPDDGPCSWLSEALAVHMHRKGKIDKLREEDMRRYTWFKKDN